MKIFQRNTKEPFMVTLREILWPLLEPSLSTTCMCVCACVVFFFLFITIFHCPLSFIVFLFISHLKGHTHFLWKNVKCDSTVKFFFLTITLVITAVRFDFFCVYVRNVVPWMNTSMCLSL